MRKDLLQLAESFLNSDSVQNADKEKKVEFLKSKGLTDEEIEEAFRKVHFSFEETPPLPPRPSASRLAYYQISPSRMTNIQIFTSAIMVVLSSMGITIAITAVIKKIMSKIFKSIANYQANRYRETKQLFERIETSIKKQPIDNQLSTEQTKLNDSIDRLAQLVEQIKRDQENPYENLKMNIDGFRDTILRQPLSSNHKYGASAFINMHYDNSNQDAAVQNIKSEIRSLKGMLLSRRNFPVVASSASIKQSVIPVPKEQTSIYHPRRRRSFRSELNPLAKNPTA